jgi:hypothetical protein
VPYNPFGTGLSNGGTWAAHLARTNGLRGGEDWPLGYGSTLPAAASGTLRAAGTGSGEFAAGWAGSAGIRAVLMLDVPVGDVVAVIYQHLSVLGAAGHYDEGQSVGQSGASANLNLYGGDTHLHAHGLTAGGVRRQFTSYFGGSGVPPVPGGSYSPGNLYVHPVTKQLFRIVDDGSEHGTINA